MHGEEITGETARLGKKLVRSLGRPQKGLQLRDTANNKKKSKQVSLAVGCSDRGLT